MPCALLVNPWIYDFAAYDLWANPLGLLSLGALLREAGWETRLLDCLDRHHPALGPAAPPERPFHVGKFPAVEVEKPAPLRGIPRRYKRYGLPREIVERELAQAPPPDLILVTSGMTYWYPGVVEIIGLLREAFPRAPLALGGIYATLCPEHARLHCRPDALVAGEAETQLAGLAGRMTGFPLRLPPALERADPGDLADLPRPAWELLRSRRALAIETSRGCPYACSYCASKLLHPRYRRKPPAKVAEEIEWAVSTLGAEDFAFYDDALLFQPGEHFLRIAAEIARRGIRARFHTPNGLFADRITPEVAGAMRAMGVATLRLSLETTNANRLAQWNRRPRLAEFTAAVRALQAVGYSREQIGVYLLCGAPGQTMEEIRESVEFVLALGASPRLAEYSPIPGAPEWERARALTPLPLGEEPLYHNNSVFYRLAGAIDPGALEALKNEITRRLESARATGAASESGAC